MELEYVKSRLAVYDFNLAQTAEVIEDAQFEVDVLQRQRRQFARTNCPHPETYERSVGTDFTMEKHCKVCDEKV
jgi:hypothetical protein